MGARTLFWKPVVPETHIEHGDEGSLQQPHQHVAPVVLVIRDSGVAHVHGEGHQEELDRGPEESGPLRRKSRLHVQLETEWDGKKGRHKRLAKFNNKMVIMLIIKWIFNPLYC